MRGLHMICILYLFTSFFKDYVQINLKGRIRFMRLQQTCPQSKPNKYHRESKIVYIKRGEII